MLNDEQIISIIKQEEHDALSYTGQDSELNTVRAEIIDYYDQKPYGTEQKGKSQIVTSEVFQCVEGITPHIMGLILQNKNVAEFMPTRKETKLEKLRRAEAIKLAVAQGADPSMLKELQGDAYEEEAKQKQAISNHIFTVEHDHEKIIYDMIKDGLTAITGWVQVYFCEEETTEVDRLTNLSEVEVEMARNNKGSTITEQEENEDGTFDITVTTKNNERRIKIENIPYEECVISRRARDFCKPPLIGQKMLKTRGEIKAMKLAPDDVVDTLAQDFTETNRVKQARHGEYGENSEEHNRNLDPSMDKLWLRRYFMQIDVDQDGIAEMWEFFYCNDVLLKKSQVYDHPYEVFVPIPKPHRAYGTSPIIHMYHYQKLLSALVRQWYNNIWALNHPRYFLSQRVNRDHWNSPVAGQGVEVKGTDVGDAGQLIPVDNQGQQIAMAIQYAESMIAKTTGYTPQDQGMDSESINKTATGILRLEERGNMRMEVMAQHLATTVENIYKKIIKLLAFHQDTEMQVLVSGEELTINPKKWADESRCTVKVGKGSAQRQEIINNLAFMLQQAKEMMQMGMAVTDSAKIYAILDAIAAQMGFKSAEQFFNDTSKPDEVLQAENEKLQAIVQAMQAELQQSNPLADVEKIKAQAMLIKAKADAEAKDKALKAKMAEQSAELEHEKRVAAANMAFNREKLDKETALKVTELQLEHDKQLKGGLIE